MSQNNKIKAGLKPGQFVFDPNEQDTEFFQDMVAKGMQPICHRCGAPLAYALTSAEAREKSVAPGIHCPVNLNHCQIAVTFGGQKIPDA